MATQTQAERTGSIKVQTGDIFPIIKKWLYSEHDIFLRELVANATDAITKRATLSRGLNQEVPAGEISVVVDKNAKTITISDNGLGMTEAEVEKYLAQLAFSGAEEFVKKMKESGNATGADIIGKFGLGFYSSFMVANKVQVESLSYQDGSAPTLWSCEGNPEYTFSPSTKKEVGTTITLHINTENEEFLNSWKVTETLRKFCDFLPYPIRVSDPERKDDKGVVTVDLINDTEPLWKKDPQTLKDEDYKTFFRKLFPMESEPLFWLHLKVDHPFTLDGVLYFPKLNLNRPYQERNIKLYCRQMFVSDNVKDVVPDFLALLKGVIDSSDIPLNVSRSSLQGDPNVKKISNYIVKKVAEALKKLFNSDRAKFETIWDDIQLFIKYGCMQDTKFDELMKEFVLFKTSAGKLVTLDEYRSTIPSQYQEKLKNKVLYFEKGKADLTLLRQIEDQGLSAVEVDDHIGPHFIQHVETHAMGKEDGKDENRIKFTTVDMEFDSLMESEATNDADMKIKDLFAKFIPQSVEDKDKVEVELSKVKGQKGMAYFKVDEQMKRWAKMAQSFGNTPFSMPVKKTLMINPSSVLAQKALKLHEKGGQEALVQKLCHYVYDLAALSSDMPKEEDREKVINRSQDLVAELLGQIH